MPVSVEFAESNRKSTERLRRLTARLTPAMLDLKLRNGWTVAVALSHIAFWDRQRLCLMRRWSAGNWCPGGYDGELFNETLLPFLQAIPPSHAAALVVRCAEEVDEFLATVPDEIVEQALARPDRPNLDRGSHRDDHLDDIEALLNAATVSDTSGLSHRPTVAPYLIVNGARGTIAFLSDVFDARLIREFAGESDRIAHAEVSLGESVIMLADGFEAWPAQPSHVHVYVPDVDATYQRALAAGAISVQPPMLQGDEDKRGGVKDAGGTTWWIATTVGQL